MPSCADLEVAFGLILLFKLHTTVIRTRSGLPEAALYSPHTVTEAFTLEKHPVRQPWNIHAL